MRKELLGAHSEEGERKGEKMGGKLNLCPQGKLALVLSKLSESFEFSEKVSSLSSFSL